MCQLYIGSATTLSDNMDYVYRGVKAPTPPEALYFLVLTLIVLLFCMFVFFLFIFLLVCCFISLFALTFYLVQLVMIQNFVCDKKTYFNASVCVFCHKI